jgi:hypothetical protein
MCKGPAAAVLASHASSWLHVAWHRQVEARAQCSVTQPFYIDVKLLKANRPIWQALAGY